MNPDHPSLVMEQGSLNTNGDKTGADLESNFPPYLVTETDLPDIDDNRTVADIEIQGSDDSLKRITTAPLHSIFSLRLRLWTVFLAAMSTLISALATATFYATSNTITAVLNITTTKTNIAITLYTIAQAIAPSILGSMSDEGGRRRSFLICFVIYIFANVGLALQTNYFALLFLRLTQAAGSSATITLSSAVISDLVTSAERSSYVGLNSAITYVGTTSGATIGGLLTNYLGWRAVFWFLAIYGGVLLVVFFFLFPETSRKVVGDGSIRPTGFNQSLFSCLQQRKKPMPEPPRKQRKTNWPNPLSTLMLFKDKETRALLLYHGAMFCVLTIICSALPKLFKDTYNLDELKIALTFMAQAGGSLFASVVISRAGNWNYQRHAKRLGIKMKKGKQQDLSKFPLEQARMEIVLPGHIVATTAIITFGWVVHYGTHLAGPLCALFFVGVGTTTACTHTNTLIMDLHKDNAGTAAAGMNFVRCLMAAGGAAAIVPLCGAVNPGWAFTIIGGIHVLLTVALIWIKRNGMTWRTEAAAKEIEKEKERQRVEMAVTGEFR